MRLVIVLAFTAQILVVQVCSAASFLPLPESDELLSRASAGEFACRAQSGNSRRSLHAQGTQDCPTDHCFENNDHEENLDIALADGTRVPAGNPSHGQEELVMDDASSLRTRVHHGTALATAIHTHTIVLNL